MRICCIVKPEAVCHEEDIRAHLAVRGICVNTRLPFRYTREMVEVLYDHMDEDAREAIAAAYVGRDAVAFCIEAMSVEQVLGIVGRESDPECCEPDTIRYRFGIRGKPMRMGSWPWWENALHRPVDMREATRDLALMFG